jgi:hypothetical protein
MVIFKFRIYRLKRVVFCPVFLPLWLDGLMRIHCIKEEIREKKEKRRNLLIQKPIQKTKQIKLSKLKNSSTYIPKNPFHEWVKYR